MIPVSIESSSWYQEKVIRTCQYIFLQKVFTVFVISISRFNYVIKSANKKNSFLMNKGLLRDMYLSVECTCICICASTNICLYDAYTTTVSDISRLIPFITSNLIPVVFNSKAYQTVYVHVCLHIRVFINDVQNVSNITH